MSSSSNVLVGFTQARNIHPNSPAVGLIGPPCERFAVRLGATVRVGGSDIRAVDRAGCLLSPMCMSTRSIFRLDAPLTHRNGDPTDRPCPYRSISGDATASNVAGNRQKLRPDHLISGGAIGFSARRASGQMYRSFARAERSSAAYSRSAPR